MEYNIGRLLGCVVGMLFGIALVLIAARFANKNKRLKTEYDERQEALRGVGYKYGFYAMFIYAAINMILALAEVPLPLEPSVLAFSYIVLGGIVDISYCIMHDCYWGLNNNRTKWGAVMGVAALINVVAVIMAIKEGAMVVDGRISTPGINAMCAILLLYLAACVAVKAIIDKKEAAE